MNLIQQVHVMLSGNPYLSDFVLTCAVLSFLYVLVSLRATLAFKVVPAVAGSYSPPISVLKPVCGLETDLYLNLRSFCCQTYPQYQVIFGVASATDPALEIIRTLIGEFPGRDLELVVDTTLVGSNRKVCNLANMFARARHDLLVIADSDMQVDANYLATVAASFTDREVGAATCLYTGKPARGLASALGASYINKWFLPSVLVALSFQKLRFCFGATMAVRRDALEAIGGFQRLASMLADDYMLGRLVSEQGFKVALVPYLVSNVVHEASLATLFQHELRWARTVRSVQPLGYSLSFITHPLPIALLCLAVTPSVSVGYSILGLAIGLRALLHLRLHRHLQLTAPSQVWLVPVRDLLSFGVWLASFLGRDVEWRTHRYRLQAHGLMHDCHRESE